MPDIERRVAFTPESHPHDITQEDVKRLAQMYVTRLTGTVNGRAEAAVATPSGDVPEDDEDVWNYYPPDTVLVKFVLRLGDDGDEELATALVDRAVHEFQQDVYGDRFPERADADEEADA